MCIRDSITTEVGQNQMWAAQYFKYKEPRTFLSSGGLGTMGYGLGEMCIRDRMCSDALIRLFCMKTRFHTEGNGDYKWIAKQLFSMSSRQDGL